MKCIRKVFPVVVLLLTLLLTACSAPMNYRTDLPAEEVTKAITKEIPAESGYRPQGSDFMQLYLKDAVPAVFDYSIVSAIAADDYAEIGVLFVKKHEDVATVEAAVTSYLDYFRETYTPQAQQYDPTELQKIEDATCRVYGNYVVYTILTEEDLKTVDETVKSLLSVAES